MLDGNLFACNFNSDLLPQNDPNANTYACGSDPTNLQIYVWISVSGFLLVVILAVWWTVIIKKNVKLRWRVFNFFAQLFIQFLLFYNEFQSYCFLLYQKRLELEKENGSNTKIENIELVQLWIFNYRARKTCLYFTLCIFGFLLPAYSSLSVYYSNYENKYAWILSPLYSSGETNGIILSILLCAFTASSIVFILYVWIFPFQDTHKLLADPERNSTSKEKLQITKVMNYFLLFLLNAGVILLSNIFYVFVLTNYNTLTIFFVQIFISFLQLGWNEVVIWKIVKRGPLWFTKVQSRTLKVIGRCTMRPIQKEETEENHNLIKTRHALTNFDVSFLSFNLSLNGLLYPAIVLIILSTDCFHNAFFQAPAVSYSYVYILSSGGGSSGISTGPVSSYSSYSPPFIYYYQCSSVIYSYYVPVFLQMLLTDGIIIPLYKLIISFYLDNHEKRKKEKESSRQFSSTQGGKGIELLSKTDPEKADGDSVSPENSSSTESKATSRITFFSRKVHEAARKFFLLDGKITRDTSVLFDKDHYVVRFNFYLLILIAYGTVFPPLALIVSVGIILRTFYEEIVIGKLLYKARNGGDGSNEDYSWIKTKLNENCKDMISPMKYSLIMTIPISVIMYSFLIFDTFGEGTPITLALTPAFLFFALSVGLIAYLNYNQHL
jgi:hypothetical protein